MPSQPSPISNHPQIDWSTPAPFPFSRESTIRLDQQGAFWHNGERIAHPGLRRAMHTWLTRHPLDGRFVLENGYDWCYLTVEGTPFFITAIRIEKATIIATLSDETEEILDPTTFVLDAEEKIQTQVKITARGGPYMAQLNRHATLALSEFIEEFDGHYELRWFDQVIPLQPI